MELSWKYTGDFKFLAVFKHAIAAALKIVSYFLVNYFIAMHNYLFCKKLLYNISLYKTTGFNVFSGSRDKLFNFEGHAHMSIWVDVHRGTVVSLNCCLIELVFMPVSAPISRKILMVQTSTEVFGELQHTLAKQLPAPAVLVLYPALLACVKEQWPTTVFHL